MKTRMAILRGIIFGLGVLAYECALYAADPTLSTMFTVAVLKDKAPDFKTFLTRQSGFGYGGCHETADTKRTTRHFPMDKPWLWDDDYVRIFYECTTPKETTYAAFGFASMETVKLGSQFEMKEPVRVTQDTAISTQAKATCSLTMCQNGTYRKTTDYIRCNQC